ncbi:MAG: sigma-54 dependent transcriptional regulator, partial [Candidatus Omnitrophica bacterium]|nr:sigma-54 dependent transcriptional regulator [Candidatus Omnitrophota bacterium]
MARKILIVDDEKNVLSSFEKIMTQAGYEIFTAHSAEEGIAMAKQTELDLLIMDIKMPGMSGLEAFSKFKEVDAKMSIIIMTAYGTTETAIEAMQLGAYDYIIKPFEVPQMKELIERALHSAKIMKTDVAYEPEKEFKGDMIIGVSSKMQQIYKTIGQVSASTMTVLLLGESGTGKELIARAVYSHSQRKDMPFMVINSAAIPETLLESELFGYEKGAFTDARECRIGKFEQCNAGTIFLDEIGDMPLSLQAKILRVLENKTFERLGGNKTIKVDVRLITATNRDLETMIKEGKFREDLYYRLNAVTINIPPLRERKEDIPQLAEYFITKYDWECHKVKSSLSAEALRKLREYNWPGNVRELENVLRKAVLFNKGSVILPEQIIIAEPSPARNKDLNAQLQKLLGECVKLGIGCRAGALYKD